MPNENNFAAPDKVKDYRLAHFSRPSFSQAEIINATGLNEKTIQNYLARYEDKMNLSAPAPGKGQRRLYSAADAVLLAAMRAIAGFELPPLKAVLFANHVRAWATVEARRYYECGFDYLPARFFAFCPSSEGNESELMIHGETFQEIQHWASEYGHGVVLIVDGKRIAQDVTRKLWARYEMVKIDNPNDPACWEKARFKPADQE